MMPAWDDYQAAAQRLDRVRRDAAAAVAEQTAAVQAARQELTVVRQRLALQRARLVDLATRAGITPPVLTPDPPLPDPPGPAAATAMLRQATADLVAADALVSEVDTGRVSRGPFPDWPQVLRNILVYGGVALLILLVQVIFYFRFSTPQTEAFALVCGATLPAVGYGIAWLTVGLLYGKVDRTPVLGAAISAAPVVLLCLGVGASAALR
jgi:hypothetical protein